jgi:hypothetical protein
MPPRSVEEGLAMSIVALTVVILTMLSSLAVAAMSWQAMASEGDAPQSRTGFGGLKFDDWTVHPCSQRAQAQFAIFLFP